MVLSKIGYAGTMFFLACIWLEIVCIILFSPPLLILQEEPWLT
jgi:hypothetical protein